MMIDFDAAVSLPDMALAQARDNGAAPVLWSKKAGAWIPVSGSVMEQTILALASTLISLGLEAGDRVVILSENRPEWAIADFAIMAAGGVTVPVYTTNTPNDHRHILDDSGATFAIVSTAALAARFLPAAATASRPIQIISIDALSITQASGPPPLTWDEAIALGTGREDMVAARLAAIAKADTACIIYTSGTGGAPKGVCLSHRAILHNCKGAAILLAELGLGDDAFLSFLPLSHAYEHTAGLMLPIALGAQIYYAESVDLLAANMAETRPTIMTAVPRLYETIRGRMLRQVERQGGLKAKLFLKAVELGRQRWLGQRLGIKDWILDRLLEGVVRRKVRARFGGRLKAFVSGGAALPYDLGLFFAGLGFMILQGYGQTEAGPVISCSPPSKSKLDTVGPPLFGISVRIADDGEILVAGDALMNGYWNDPADTKRAIPDGEWLHTGDVGFLDTDGYIRITDRKKDIIVVSGGDNVSPQRIEGLLTLQPEIAQAMVFGDGKAHIAALIVGDDDLKPDLAAIGKAVERVNAGLSPIEKIRKWAVLDSPFTTENGMLTPSMKIRRHVIMQTHADVIADMR